MKKPSERIIKFIHSFESYHRRLPNGDCTAYKDPTSKTGEPITIGYGTTVYRAKGRARYVRSNVELGDVLTHDEAYSEFVAYLDICASVANKANPNLTQNQFDAVVSFFYNAGTNTPQTDRLKRGQLDEFAKRLPSYNRGVDGEVAPGLVRRRRDELAIFLEGKTVPTATWIALTRVNDKYIFRAMAGPVAVAQHEWTTTAQLIGLLRQYPEAGTTVVTKEDWQPEKVEVVPPATPSTATLIRTTTRLPNGHVQLQLKVKDKAFNCISGQGYAQNFRRPQDPRSVPGNMEPIPQGRYTIGAIEWAGTPGDWSRSFGPGLGPVWVGLTATFSDDRSAFGIHLDAGPVGSAGCVVFSQSVLEDLLPELKGVRFLDVNWGV